MLKKFILTFDRKYLILLILSPTIILYIPLQINVDTIYGSIISICMLTSQIVIFSLWLFILGNFLVSIETKYQRKFKNNFIKYVIIIVFCLFLGNYLSINLPIKLTLQYKMLIILYIMLIFINIYYTIKVIYIISKIFSVLKYEKETKFDDIFGILVAFLIFPIGIWLYQQKITEIYYQINKNIEENNM
jgi:hypothetical protein